VRGRSPSVALAGRILAWSANFSAAGGVRDAWKTPGRADWELPAPFIDPDTSAGDPEDAMKRQLSREQVIDGIRTKLLGLVDDEHSICEVTTTLGIFCGGYSQMKTGELRRRYDWIVKNRPWMKRKEIEDVANRWQLVRQQLLGTQLACDTQAREGESHPTCEGWTGFSNGQMESYYRELLGEDVEIVDARIARPDSRPAKP
jgi:hypothetical protein